MFHAPLIAATPGLTLAVIASGQGSAARSAYPGVTIVSDFPSAIRQTGVELVVIATPNDTHASLAEAALRAGKHVVVDKPFTLTSAEARALTAMAAETGRVLSVFQNRRWDSDFLGVRREIAAGRVGDVVEVRSEMSRHRPEVRDRWRERAGPGSGLWYDLGPHLIDQALLLLGPPESIQADLQVQRRGGSAVDWFQVVLGYGSTRVVLSSSMLAPDNPPRFLVRGTTGSLIKLRGDVQEGQLARGLQPGTPGWGVDPDPLIFLASEEQAPVELPAPAGNYLEYYTGVREAVRGSGEPPVTPAQAVAVMDLIEAGRWSSAEGRVFTLRPTAAARTAWSR